MEAIYDKVYLFYEYVIKFSVIVIELISAGIIVFTVIKALVDMIKGRDDIQLEVSEGVSLALEFKLGGEVLRTLIVRELSELLVLGSIILLMIALSIFVQWGIKNERKNKSNKPLNRFFDRKGLKKSTNKPDNDQNTQTEEPQTQTDTNT